MGYFLLQKKIQFSFYIKFCQILQICAFKRKRDCAWFEVKVASHPSPCSPHYRSAYRRPFALSHSLFFFLFLVQLTFLYRVLSKSCPLQIGSWLVKGPGASWDKHINSPRARSFSLSPLSFSFPHNWVFVIQEWDDFSQMPLWSCISI